MADDLPPIAPLVGDEVAGAELERIEMQLVGMRLGRV
jgi:hypothetical protein